MLRHGDRITAGATTFHVQIEGAQPAAVPAVAPRRCCVAAARGRKHSAKGDSGFKHVEPPTAARSLRSLFELDEAAKALLDDKQTPRQFFDAIDQAAAISRRGPPAGPRAAEARGRLVGQPMRPRGGGRKPDAAPTASAWKRPSAGSTSSPKRIRRAAEKAAEATGYETASRLVRRRQHSGAAAAWPRAGMPDVPPKETLTPQAAVVAITLAANSEPPQKTPERYAEFLSLGSRVADGESRWLEKR